MRNSNFEFLRPMWNELYEIGQFAEKVSITDPNTTLIKLRLFAELLLKFVSMSEGIHEPYRMNQKERLEFLLKEQAITPEVYLMLDTIRVIGNKAVHEPNYGSINEAKRMLKLAFHLGGWLRQLYQDWNYEIPEFKDPQPVKESKVSKETADLHIETTSIAGVIQTFSNDDHEYELWLNTQKQGFVFNYFGGGEASREMNKIHSASCRYLHRKQDEGKRTTTFPKICSTNLAKLEKHVANLRGTSWVYCKSCMNN